MRCLTVLLGSIAVANSKFSCIKMTIKAQQSIKKDDLKYLDL